MSKKNFMIVFGTRPEAIKMCPLVNELKLYENINVTVCVTGQHKEMLDQVLNVFDVKPEYNLKIMKKNQSLFEITNSILVGMKDILLREKPDLVLVHGDTTTTFATALSCFYLQIPIAHVEAGLRTKQIYSPFPEEFNRQAVSLIAKYHFAPTLRAKQNLIAEGKSEEDIYITGNTAIDALNTTVKADYSSNLIDWAKGSKLILVTAHRRENLGKPMKNMFSAIRRIINEHSDVKAIYPVHLNPKIQNLALEFFRDESRMKLVAPLDVIEFHNILARSYMVLTDSGGIQEEAPSLGVPVLVMRDTTERPEGIIAGTLKLVGTEEKNIYTNFKKLIESPEEYSKMKNAVNPYGDGTACNKILEILRRKENV